MNNLTNPIAIVRSEEKEVSESVFYWHEKCQEANKARNLSNLSQAESLYHIDRMGGYKELGYDSMGEYVYKCYDRSKPWADKLVGIHKKFVEELGISNEKLLAATFGKLSKVLAHITKDNVDEILDMLPKMKQDEVDDLVRKLKGDSPTDEKEQGQIRLKGPIEIIESIQSAMDIAKSELCQTSSFYQYESEVPDLLSVEFLASSFMSGVSLAGDPYETLENALKALEHNYNVKITWTENE